MKISVFGLGYVGCVSLACLADFGHDLIGVDVNEKKVESINAGKATIIEKDIDEFIARNHKKGRISATTKPETAITNSDISFVAVGTPNQENGHLSMDYIYNTAREIGQALRHKESFHIVIIRSTVVPGTNETYAGIIEAESGKQRNSQFAVVSNPEFMREGSAVKDFLNPPYTIIGSESKKAISIVQQIYKEIEAPFFSVSIRSAEMIKYVNNTYHALKVAFANEIGNICQSYHVNSLEVMQLFTSDTVLNISEKYFAPGFAYGGSCLPKDLKGLNALARDANIPAPIIGAIENSNNLHIEKAIRSVLTLEKKAVGVLGLSFKIGTDDLRMSPTIELVERLLGKGITVSVFDHNVQLHRLTGSNKDYLENHLPHIANLLTKDSKELLRKSEVIVLTHNDDDYIRAINSKKDVILVDLVNVKDKIKTKKYIGLAW
jgi:GDP-mannose 6-dehydrogenase